MEDFKKALEKERAAHAATRVELQHADLARKAALDLLDEARAVLARVEQERDALREDNARLNDKCASLARCYDDVHVEHAAHEHTKAKLGRAVAALREAKNACERNTGEHLQCRVCAATSDLLGPIIHMPRCPFTILADAESTAAGEAYAREREERAELIQKVRTLREWIGAEGQPRVAIEQARKLVDEFLAKVDARRAGGKDGAK